MTNVLIPTDFTTASLKLAENALRETNLQKCNFILFHAFSLPDFPFELLTARQTEPVNELMNEPFRQACKRLKDEYPSRIGKLVVRCMTGDTRALFRNFIDANDIDVIYCPDHYIFKAVHKRSVDPCYLFKKCGIPVLKNIVQKTESRQSEPAFNLQLSS